MEYTVLVGLYTKKWVLMTKNTTWNIEIVAIIFCIYDDKAEYFEI